MFLQQCGFNNSKRKCRLGITLGQRQLTDQEQWSHLSKLRDEAIDKSLQMHVSITDTAIKSILDTSVTILRWWHWTIIITFSAAIRQPPEIIDAHMGTVSPRLSVSLECQLYSLYLTPQKRFKLFSLFLCGSTTVGNKVHSAVTVCKVKTDLNHFSILITPTAESITANLLFHHCLLLCLPLFPYLFLYATGDFILVPAAASWLYFQS